MLVDPKGGVGFAFGEKLPSGHINTVFAQQIRAFDATNGGSWTLGTAATIAGSAALNLNGSGYLNVARPTAFTTGGVEFDVNSVVNSGRDLEWLGTTNLPKLGSREYIFAQPMVPAYHLALTNVWGFDVANGEWNQGDVGGGTAPHVLPIPLTRLPHQATMTKCRIIIDGDGNGAGGNHGATLPATLPTATLYKRTLSVSTGSTVGATQVDVPGSAAQYDTIHAIATSYDAGLANWTWEGLSELITSNVNYWVVIVGESGANSVASALAVVGIECAFTCTAVAPG